ncbi:hypothetical protein GWK47_037206 [Chionoecetes opilio]|uniref:HAT C-terminal dimerisation domain-containing protein n=1 Tax=Chionoecetes opilio TaxID=41210 RepID=A0A8J5D1I6_CHIOP|nr:hypothetical protein GWK47_037206 [Chionoecetes opilio]
MVRVPLRDLEENGLITKETFLGKSKCFFDTAVNYLEAWGKHADDLQDLSCLLLKKKPQRLEVEKAVETRRRKCPNVTIDEDILFDEVSGLQELLQGGILEEWKREDTPLIQKWGSVISHFQLNEIPLINIARLASVVICLPGSNAPVERVFSLMNDMWTAERNRFTVSTMKALLTVKTNFNHLPCQDFMEMLTKNKPILKKIHSSEKYTD